MRLQVSRWGNSLAIRLPTDCLREVGLKEGDSVEATVTPRGEICLTPGSTFDRATFLARVSALHTQMEMTTPVLERIRQEERY